MFKIKSFLLIGLFVASTQMLISQLPFKLNDIKKLGPLLQSFYGQKQQIKDSAKQKIDSLELWKSLCATIENIISWSAEAQDRNFVKPGRDLDQKEVTFFDQNFIKEDFFTVPVAGVGLQGIRLKAICLLIIFWNDFLKSDNYIKLKKQADVANIYEKIILENLKKDFSAALKECDDRSFFKPTFNWGLLFQRMMETNSVWIELILKSLLSKISSFESFSKNLNSIENILRPISTIASQDANFVKINDLIKSKAEKIR